ncbi:MAG: homoserine kinase [Terriglobales bacterium]
MRRRPGPLRLALPATSANLGAGFDAAALAMDLRLCLAARPAADWRLVARGRDRTVCGRREGNLLLATYQDILAGCGRPAPPLHVELTNAIPIGKGCGSSAAARLAGIAMAVHFGRLGWNGSRIEATAAALEGHGDNVAACWRGGAVCCIGRGEAFHAIELGRPRWPLLLAVPRAPLPTAAARAALPRRYSRAAAVANVQAAMLLAAALRGGHDRALAWAMADRLHEPYRAALCPLLPALKPLARDGAPGPIAGVALSGAGPSVLVIVNGAARLAAARRRARAALRRAGLEAELLVTRITGRGARISWAARGLRTPGVGR